MKLSIHSNATSAAAVPSVSQSPQRYAAAARTKTKNKKNGVLGPSAKMEISAGHTMSPACTRRRNAAVDCCRRRSSIKIKLPFAR